MKYPSKLEELGNMAEDLGLSVSTVASRVLGDEKFALWSGSGKKGQHHYGTGGLQHHTWEVATLALQNSLFFGEQGIFDFSMHRKEIFLAALFHDIGKVEDYAVDGSGDSWVKTPHARDIHHISRSALVYIEAASAGSPPPFDKEFNDRVLHAILSHHGTREWGSPVMPHSHVAWLLHLCDGLSARMNDAATWDFTKLTKE